MAVLSVQEKWPETNLYTTSNTIFWHNFSNFLPFCMVFILQLCTFQLDRSSQFRLRAGQNMLVFQNASNSRTQLSNLWWMSNSDCMGFGTAMRTGSSRRYKRYLATYYVSFMLASLQCGLKGCPWFILICSKGHLTWHSPIGCRVSFELSWWACSHGSARTHADWDWNSS